MFRSLQAAEVLFQVNNPVIGNLLLFVPVAFILYFLMFRPAQVRAKKVQEMLSSLKNGDKVITNGGLFGTIVGLEGDSVQLRIADQVKVKVLRSAVASLQPEIKEES